MNQMMDYELWKQRREEMLREAEMNRQVNRAGSIEAAPKVVEGTAGSINLRVSG